MTEFEELGLTPGILEAIRELGFAEPMPVQKKVIPLMTGSDQDIIALAQTGTGKTAAFGLPLVLMTDTVVRDTQALVLCPTRELCIQITGDLKSYSKYTGKLKTLAVYGGASIENQIKGLQKGAHIIVATPGRLLDLIGRGVVLLNNVGTVILDEADEMLNMGFLDSIREILQEVPAEKRTLLFSATMSPVIASIARKYMHHPVEVTVGSKNASAENVSHGYYMVHARDKYKVLKRIADFEPGIYGIVFCRTRKDTQEVAARLVRDGYNADALHGDLSQAQRDSVMQKFRSGNLRLLVATDVAARGLDVDNLTHVINFSLPEDTEVYTHRCGRTGRAGKKGKAISLVHLKEKHQLQKIERGLKKSFAVMSVPTGNEICGKQLFNWAGKLEEVSANHPGMERFLPGIMEKLENFDREELLRRVVSLEFDKFLDDYRTGEEQIETFTEEEISYNRSEKQASRHAYQGTFKRLFINLGKSDGFYPEHLISLVNASSKGRSIPIGKIDLQKNFSFFEVATGHADYLIGALNNAVYMDRQIVVDAAQAKRNETFAGRFQERGQYRPPEKKNRKKKKKKSSRKSW